MNKLTVKQALEQGYKTYLYPADGFQRGNVLGEDEPHDTATKKLVLAIVTANIDDWYPYCVLEWNPQNMKCNIDR